MLVVYLEQLSLTVTTTLFQIYYSSTVTKFWATGDHWYAQSRCTKEMAEMVQNVAYFSWLFSSQSHTSTMPLESILLCLAKHSYINDNHSYCAILTRCELSFPRFLLTSSNLLIAADISDIFCCITLSRSASSRPS